MLNGNTLSGNIHLIQSVLRDKTVPFFSSIKRLSSCIIIASSSKTKLYNSFSVSSAILSDLLKTL